MSVTVIIPAYNEEKYLGGVLLPLKEVGEITQIVVVSDGSTDGTVNVALSTGVDVIDLKENLGKGGAMAQGLKSAQEEVILFLDADLIGLTPRHINDLIQPVLNDEADMSIGIFDGGRLVTDMAQVIAPFLSGQRCMKKKWLVQFENMDNTGFGIEAALTAFAEEQGLRISEITLHNMSHVMKEEKHGLVRGFAYRMKMYWEVAKKVRMGGDKYNGN